VEWQIRVALCEALPKAQPDLHACGHAIELRLCAEDEHFVPHSGTITYFEAPQGAVRMDHAVQSGTVVSPYYDPMVGKLIVHGATRDEAIDQALQGLRNTQLLGITSNQTLLAAILGHADFRQGQAHIGWLGTEQAKLASHIAAREANYLPLAALACQALGMPANGSTRLACAFPVQGVLQHRGVRWPYVMTPLAGGDLQLEWHDAAPVPPGTQQCAIARIVSRQAKGPGTLQVRVALDGVQHTVHVHAEGATLRQLHLHNSSFWISDQTHSAQTQDEGKGHAALRSPMNGKILAVLVAEGASVKKGDTLVVLESMKLEHRLQAARDGLVARVAAEVGAQAGTGQLLVELST
jgi:3-methylcrotonyl-CoA carboxylase alpha subunit/geranyl-CoA carboxylase alpha subunit